MNSNDYSADYEKKRKAELKAMVLKHWKSWMQFIAVSIFYKHEKLTGERIEDMTRERKKEVRDSYWKDEEFLGQIISENLEFYQKIGFKEDDFGTYKVDILQYLSDFNKHIQKHERRNAR